MIVTTRQVNVELDKGQKKLQGVTTKTVDGSFIGYSDSLKFISTDELLQEVSEEFRAELPENKPVETQSISTHNIADAEAIKDKMERDAIIAQRKKDGRPEPDPADAEPKEGEIKVGKTTFENLAAGEEEASNIMFETVKKGKVEFEKLATVFDKSFQMRHIVVEIDGLDQAISRRELK